MHRFLDDLRRAATRLRRSHRLSLFAIALFALGTGAHLMLFSAVDTLASIAPTPVLNPTRVVHLQVQVRGARPKDFALPAPLFEPFRNQIGEVAEVAEAARLVAPVVGQGVRRRSTPVMMVSGSYFSLLGARPALGRWFTPDDDRVDGGADVAVLSDTFWRNALGGDSAILGTELEIARRHYTVVGVAPRGFPGAGLASADLWIPVNRAIRAGARIAEQIVPPELPLLARLRGDLPTPQAARHMTDAYQQITRQDTATIALLAASATRVTGSARFPWAGGLLVAFLLAVTAGGANLLLLRAIKPRQEAAVRAALGAGARPLVALLALDVLILMTVGITVGLLAALSVQSVAETYSLTDPMRISGAVRLLGPIATAAIVAGALVSIMPALHAAEAGADDHLGPARLATLFGTPDQAPSSAEAHSPQLALVDACPCDACRKKKG